MWKEKPSDTAGGNVIGAAFMANSTEVSQKIYKRFLF